MKQSISNSKKANRPNQCRQIDLTSLRISTKEGLEFDAHLEPTQSFSINKKSNYISTIMILSSYIIQKYPVSEPNLFLNYKIHNVPQQFRPFTHPETLNNLLNIFQNKSQSLLQIIDLMCSYPIMEFLVHCLGRKIIHDFILSSMDEFDLMGNELDLLENYEIQMRGNLLECLARSLNQEIVLKFPTFCETYGKSESLAKIEITSQGQKCYWTISQKKNNDKKQIKLLSSFSSKNIQHITSPKMANSLTLIDTTSEQLSVKKSGTASLKREEMSTQYQKSFNNLKYISPRQLNTHTRYLTDSLQLHELKPKKLAIKQNYKLCIQCKQMYCSCKV